MDTRMLGYEHAASVTEIALWANDLIGKEVPDSPGYTLVRVIQFQLLPAGGGYDALLLAEVSEQLDDMRVVLKEADIQVIEQLTSSIEEAP